ncbi:hypothetical protein M404DRAFT_162126 [Pisolithus tinctorius Marx 270]|uniref:DDE Tnp4 domain-containing protein n=1 Tax=Pisolithus tinctorius Marx 270 TaxID=870435 RepID=A0A0C3IIN9_PISTI|nr:hypothetical protein M404DRAFT_162126 [Pisolithus tinctorius Marx 270]
MPHNLLVVDYGLGHPGSVHDAWVFQGTCIASRPGDLIPEDHWTWADSTYPMEEWCAVPFKKPKGGGLSHNQNLYNKYLSKHAFAALKGRFQSLHELHLKIQNERDVKVTVYWVMCCIILHNMVICFEEEMVGSIEPSSWWAMEEGSGQQDGDMVVVGEAVGTPGQQFQMRLVDELFQYLGHERT